VIVTLKRSESPRFVIVVTIHVEVIESKWIYGDTKKEEDFQISVLITAKSLYANLPLIV